MPFRLRKGAGSAPAPHLHARSGHIGSGVRRQEQNAFRHFLGLAGPAHGHQRPKPREPIRRAATRMDFGFNQARVHRIHPHAFLRDFARKADGQRIHGCLAGRVMHIFASTAEF